MESIPSGDGHVVAGELGGAGVSSKSRARWQLPHHSAKKLNPAGEEDPFNWTLMTVVFIAASAGLLFGYDLGVIGALPAIPGFAEFHAEGTARGPPPASPAPSLPTGDASSGGLCSMTSGVEPPLGVYLTISMFAAGMLGGLIGSYTSATFGRRASLVYAAAIYTFGTCMEGMAWHLAMFYVGRIFVGVGIGLANQVAPVYLAEIAPAQSRGAINISFQFFITFGILLSTVVSFLLIFFGVAVSDPTAPAVQAHGWRWHLIIGAIPGLFVMFGAICLTETPQYLMGSAKEDSRALAYYTLSELRQHGNVDREFERMTLYCDRRPGCLETWRNMFLDRRRVPPIVVTTALVVFQQITFLNGFLFFLPTLFNAGLTSNEAQSNLYASLTNSIINFFATTIAIFTADRFGRRPLFFSAGAVMGVMAIIMAVLIKTIDNAANVNQTLAFGIITVVELFVAGYAWSWGPLPWAMPAELNAWPWRTAGTSFAVIVNFAISIVVAAVFPYLLCALKYGLFILIFIVLLAGTATAYLLFPESAHCDLNETEFLFKGHWFWQRFYPESERIELVMRLGCTCCSDEVDMESLYFPAACPSREPADGSSVQPTLTDLYGVPSSVRSNMLSSGSATAGLPVPLPATTTTLGRGISAALKQAQEQAALEASARNGDRESSPTQQPR